MSMTILKRLERKNGLAAQLILEFLSRKDFQKDAIILRNKWFHTDDRRENYRRMRRDLSNENGGDEDFLKDIHSLMNSYYLHTGWQDTIERYLAMKGYNPSDDPEAPKLGIDLSTGKIWLELYN